MTAYSDIAYVHLPAEERATRPGALASLLGIIAAALLAYALWFVVTAEAVVTQEPDPVPACIQLGALCPPL